MHVVNGQEFVYLQRDPSLMPFLPKTMDPKEIVARVRGDQLPKIWLR